MKARVVDFDETYSSQLFGETEMPDEWLEKDVFAPCEFFLCKLDLAECGGGEAETLASDGYLYIFVDMPSKIGKARAIVRFFDGEPDACTDFNDGYFDDEPCGYSLVFDESGTMGGTAVSEAAVSGAGKSFVTVNERNCGDLTLIAIGKEYLPEDLGISELAVIVDADAAKKGDFSSVRIVAK